MLKCLGLDVEDECAITLAPFSITILELRESLEELTDLTHTWNDDDSTVGSTRI